MVSLKWNEAQSYCRQYYTDLATIDNQDENTAQLIAWKGPKQFAWIGLHDDTTRWKWALGNADFNNKFSPWLKNEPSNTQSKENCTVMRQDGLWLDSPCSTTRPAVCYYGKKDLF